MVHLIVSQPQNKLQNGTNQMVLSPEPFLQFKSYLTEMFILCSSVSKKDVFICFYVWRFRLVLCVSSNILGPGATTRRSHAQWIMRTEGFSSCRETAGVCAPAFCRLCAVTCMWPSEWICMGSARCILLPFLHVVLPPGRTFGFSSHFPPLFYVGHCCLDVLVEGGGGSGVCALRRAFCFLEELRYDSKPWQSDAEARNNNYFGYNRSSPNTGCSVWR